MLMNNFLTLCNDDITELKTRHNGMVFYQVEICLSSNASHNYSEDYSLLIVVVVSFLRSEEYFQPQPAFYSTGLFIYAVTTKAALDFNTTEQHAIPVIIPGLCSKAV